MKKMKGDAKSQGKRFLSSCLKSFGSLFGAQDRQQNEGRPKDT